MILVNCIGAKSYLTGLPVETLPFPLQGSFHTELVIMSSLAVNSTPVYYDLYKNLPFELPYGTTKGTPSTNISLILISVAVTLPNEKVIRLKREKI